MTDIEDFGVDPDYELARLVTFLRQEEARSYDEWVQYERANALEFYNGEPFGDEEEGRSQVVTRDVAEVVDYMTVSLLRTMVSGDRVVEFEHKDKRVAEEATAIVTREFFQGQDGYRFLHDWIKAGLLEKNSTAKCCIEDVPPKLVTVTLPEEGIAQIEQEGLEVISATPDGQGGFSVVYNEPQPPRFRDYVVPNEECHVAQDARVLDEDCAYIGFRMKRTLSQLAEMGFDTDGIVDDNGYYTTSETLTDARSQGNTQFWRQGFNRDGANRTVWYFEEYATFDLNGDGIAELLQIHRVGNKILVRSETGQPACYEIDEQPGVDWCPFPMPHRRIGQSLADKVMDIQRTRSVLLRQGLDNLYQTNAPRTLIHEDSIGENTIDDMLTLRAGALVRWKGNVAPAPIQVPFAADAAFQVMEVMAGEKESRTGITRLNQGLDADALNKTATGTALMQAQGQQIEEYVARNFAEAFARLMRKKYNLMRRFGGPSEVTIDGETVTVDPRQWPDDINVMVRVGLGSGRKEQRLQYRTMVLEMMAAAKQNGSRIVEDEGVYNMIKGVIADASLGNVRDYLVDPATLGEAQPQPDPKMAEAQARAMIAAEKQDADRKAAEADMELRAHQARAEADLRQMQLEADLAATRERAQLEADLARDKANFEAQLAQQTADREFALAMHRIELEHQLAERRHELAESQAMEESEPASEDLPNNRPGGALDA